MKSLFLFLLRAYKLTISPYLGQNCRFYPSCSAYADIAIRRHGVVKGSLLAGKRLCKCHPWHAGGIDLVPERPVQHQIEHEQTRDLQPQSGLKLARPSIAVLKKAANDQFIGPLGAQSPGITAAAPFQHHHRRTRHPESHLETK